MRREMFTFDESAKGQGAKYLQIFATVARVFRERTAILFVSVPIAAAGCARNVCLNMRLPGYDSLIPMAWGQVCSALLFLFVLSDPVFREGKRPLVEEKDVWWTTKNCKHLLFSLFPTIFVSVSL